jgi:hypothetical protein
VTDLKIYFCKSLKQEVFLMIEFFPEYLKEFSGRGISAL